MTIHIRTIFLALCAPLIFTGCSDTDGVTPEPGEGTTLLFQPTAMLPQVLISRAVEESEPKTSEEKRINRLHLFFFDSNGEFLQPNPDASTAGFEPYHIVNLKENELAAVNIPRDAFVGQADLTGVQIYAVANPICCEADCNHEDDRFRTTFSPEGKICHGSADSDETEITITNLNDLLQWYYRPAERTDITQLPAGGMPMVAHFKAGADEKILAGNQRLSLPMKALMSRVDVKVRLDANQTSHDHSLPTLKVTEFGIRNMPLCVPFTELGADEITKVPLEEIIPEKTVKVEDRTLIDGQEGALFTYYTYENVRHPNRTPENIPDIYPDAVKDKGEDVRQRWKPQLADPAACSAFIMKGHYITHQGLEYDAQFTVYLGSNVVDNFEVRRNCCYKNTISIRGLDYVRNSDPTVYTFDGRVNVITDNPVYISIVNERKIDAHATALPMDIYFLRVENGTVDCRSQVEVELLGDAGKWIRMESVSAERMAAEAGVYTNSDGHTDELPPFSAGKGARKYFTNDLFTTLPENNKLVIGNNYQGSDPNGGNRTRVYFYIEENVPPKDNYGDRTARVRIHYTNDNGEDRDRILQIDQKALLRVDGIHRTENQHITGWMEYYEEYIDHKDPLDKHEMPGELYSGLPWGLDRVRTGDGFNNPFNVYTNGLDMTYHVLGISGVNPISSIQLFNTVEPQSAFHYCAGKNKRDENGGITEQHWYMPGIRELEVALEQFYSTFPEFQGYFYWSAAAGKSNQPSSEYGTLINPDKEVRNRARATRVDGSGNYVNSETVYEYIPLSLPVRYRYVSDQPGSISRTTPLRIRAFYKSNPD